MPIAEKLKKNNPEMRNFFFGKAMYMGINTTLLIGTHP